MNTKTQVTVYTTLRIKRTEEKAGWKQLAYKDLSFHFQEPDGSWDYDNCMLYCDFNKEQGRLTAAAGILNARSIKYPLMVAVGDARVATQEGQLTQIAEAYRLHLATYVAKVNVFLTEDEHRKMLGSTVNSYKNAHLLPQGVEIKEENIEGLWLVSKLNEFEVVIYAWPTLQNTMIKDNEIAIWEDPASPLPEQWLYKVGPYGVPAFLDIANDNMPNLEIPGESDNKGVLYQLKAHKRRVTVPEYNGRSPFGGPKRGEIARVLELSIVNLLIGRGQIPANGSYAYDFPAFIGPNAELVHKDKLKELNQKREMFNLTFHKIKTKQAFIDFWNELQDTIQEAMAIDAYIFDKIAADLEAMIPKFLNANQKLFFKQSSSYDLLSEIFQFLDVDVDLDKFRLNNEDGLDLKILNIFLKHQQNLHKIYDSSDLTNAVETLKQQTLLSNFEDLDRNETLSKLREAFKSAQNMEDLVNYSEKILSERWERIRETDLAYTRCAARSPLSLLCQRLGKLVADYRKGDKIIYQYLMPTLTGCYDKFSDVHLKELKINQFIIDETHENGYDLQMLYNHHTHAQDDPQAMDTAFWDPHLPYDEEGMGVPLSEDIVLRLIYHSRESREYHLAYEAFRDAKKTDSTSYYLPLKELAAGLMKGSVKGSGSEYIAGAEAMEAIAAFSTFLVENPDIQKELFALPTGNTCFNYSTNAYEEEKLLHVWDILTGKNTKALNCVYINSNKITSLLLHSKNQAILQVGENLARKERIFKTASQRFLSACENNHFTFDQFSHRYPANLTFNLLLKHYKNMEATALIKILNDLHIPEGFAYPSKKLVAHLIKTIANNPLADLTPAIQAFDKVHSFDFEISKTACTVFLKFESEKEANRFLDICPHQIKPVFDARLQRDLPVLDAGRIPGKWTIRIPYPNTWKRFCLTNPEFALPSVDNIPLETINPFQAMTSSTFFAKVPATQVELKQVIWDKVMAIKSKELETGNAAMTIKTLSKFYYHLEGKSDLLTEQEINCCQSEPLVKQLIHENPAFLDFLRESERAFKDNNTCCLQ